jgi:hypothetical protein
MGRYPTYDEPFCRFGGRTTGSLRQRESQTMNLTKTLRENGKTLLMIFMALLLVAFLIPQQIQGCADRRRAEVLRVGQAFGRNVSSQELQAAAAEMDILRSMGAMQQGPTPLDYYLLRAEADAAGVRVGRDEIISILRGGGVGDTILAEVQARHRVSYDRIYEVLGNWMAVNRYRGYQVSAIFDSLPRQRLAYRNANQNATARISTLESRAFERLVPEPTEEQLQAFFDACKDRTTAHTPDELVFGYKRPDRLRYEYLTVDPAKIKSRVQVRTAQVEQYFKDNAGAFTKPDPLATQPVEGQPPPEVPMTFEEARDIAREELRERRAVEDAQRVLNDIHAEVSRKWLGLERDKSGYVSTPPETESFEQIARRYAERGVEFIGSDFVDQAGLQRIPGLSQAVVSDRMRLTAAQLAFRVQGLFTPQPGDPLPVLSLMEPSGVMSTRQTDPRTRRPAPRQPYLMRIVAVAPSAPPASMDEVRDQLVKDWKTVQAFALAKAEAEKLAARAREVGLDVAVQEATALKEILAQSEAAATQPAGASPVPPRYVAALEPFSPQRLIRQAAFIEQVGNAPGTAMRIFALEDDAEDPATQPAHKIAALAVPSSFKWLVAELVAVQPVYEGSFEMQLAQAAERGAMMSFQRFEADWRAPQNVAARTGFVAAPRPERGSESDAE